MVVGDDSQSIYSFRGANYRNMFDFPELFPGCKIVKLEENYRSTQPILAFTNALMEPARERYTKCLFSKRRGQERPRVIDVKTAPEQALFLGRSIRDQLQKGRSLKDIAVLFRAAYHSFDLEVELARQGLPFVKYGGFKFVESAHIKDLLAHLRALLNRDDTVSWGRVLRLIKNVGQQKSQAIIRWMRQSGSAPWQVGEWPGAGKADGGLRALCELLKALSANHLTPKEATERVSAYYNPLLRERFDDFPRREKDLEQLVTMAGRYRKLRPFLDDLILEPPTSAADLGPEQRGDRLTLSTVHSAKGLEWPVVYIIWVMEGYFPSAKNHANEDAMEEERRLMYVAATRAKDELILCYPGREAPRGGWAHAGALEMGYGGGLSSFVRDLPGEVLEHGSSRSSAARPAGLRSSGGFPLDRQGKDSPCGLRPGDRVGHPAFGPGVVSRLVGKDKVEVLFRDQGRKLLHLGYTTLEKR
jgi:DNA helicase-2/ATP-dependent DNA helicase PcrA